MNFYLWHRKKMIKEQLTTKTRRREENTEAICNLCGNACTHTDLQFNSCWLVKCAQCGVIQVHPFPSEKEILSLYADENFAREDGTRFKGVAEKISVYFRKQRARTIQKTMRSVAVAPSPFKKILDIGAGRGVMLEELQKKGWDVYGTHPASLFQKHDEKFSLYYGSLTNAKFPDSFFDCVTLFHVLEHLENPRQTLYEIHYILKPGGALIIEIPNAEGFIPQLFKTHWLGYHVPFHLYHFTEKCLEELLRSAGFSVERKKNFSLEQSPFILFQTLLNFFFHDRDGFFNARMAHKKQKLQFSKIFFYATCAVLLSFPCLIFSLLCGILKKGDIITFYCRKTEVITRA